MDEYTEQTTTGLGGRLLQSLKAVIIGLIFFVAAFPVLWLNEGYAVRTASSLKQGANEVVSITADSVDAANEGKLVHVAGRAETTDSVADPMFGISVQAIRLRRKVEMYQWEESSSTRKQKHTGGSETTTTTYSYKLVWSERPIDSSRFKKAQEHANPAMPFSSADYIADNVTLGAFRLTREIAGQLTASDPVDISAATLPPAIEARARKAGSMIEVGDPASPQAGDLRISFVQLKASDVSIVARQAGKTFAPYRAKAGGTIQLVEMGIQAPDTMFASAQSANTVRTWIFRALGLILMFAGLMAMLSPLATVADVVPFIGSLLRGGTALVSALVAISLSLVTVATAWIAYRPLVGVGLLAGAAVLLYAIIRLRGKNARSKARFASAS